MGIEVLDVSSIIVVHGSFSERFFVGKFNDGLAPIVALGVDVVALTVGTTTFVYLVGQEKTIASIFQDVDHSKC